MSERQRRLIFAVAGGLLLVAICAGFALSGYMLGRRSVSAPEGSDTIAQSTEAQDAGAQEAVEAEVAFDSGPVPTAKALPTPIVESDAGKRHEGEQASPSPETIDSTAVPVATATTPAVDIPSAEELQRQRDEFDLRDDDLALLVEAWRIIGREFDGRLPTEEELVYAAIEGSVETLEDRFTRFIRPEVAEMTRELLRGSFEGIGAYVDLNDEGLLIIIEPIAGQPADLAGLVRGDIVTHVNGISIRGMALDEIISAVKGPKGTGVTLTILRDPANEPFDVTIIRDDVELPVVEWEMLEDDIGYVQLFSFSSSADERLETALLALVESQARAIILDLRNNPGGFLNQSVAVADLFLNQGVILLQRTGLGHEQVFRSSDDDAFESIPLAVLVNSGSASASEIVAGAIRDRGRGVLIGETTFGKGSVQQTHTLSDGSELRVTIARWFTPNNQSIDGLGIEPNIVVSQEDRGGISEDPQLQRAIEYLLDAS